MYAPNTPPNLNIGFYPFQVVRIPPPLALNG
jgi:hypothetical protein